MQKENQGFFLHLSDDFVCRKKEIILGIHTKFVHLRVCFASICFTAVCLVFVCVSERVDLGSAIRRSLLTEWARGSNEGWARNYAACSGMCVWGAVLFMQAVQHTYVMRLMYAFVSLAPPYSPRKPIPIAFPHLHICFISNLRQLFYFIFPFSFVVLPTICVFRFQSSLAIVHTRELQTKTLYVCMLFPFGFLPHTHTHTSTATWLVWECACSGLELRQPKIKYVRRIKLLVFFSKTLLLILGSNLFLENTSNNCYYIPFCTPFLLISPSAHLLCFLGHICWFQFVAQSQSRAELLNLLIFIFSIASKII